jgi:DNA repair protein RecN (Recombination protein N)
MLSQLSIRDIVLIERLDISFTHALSVLTGETGAGKSILLDALSLALGARGDAGLVRQGASQGQVTAMFDLPLSHPIYAVLDENGITHEGYVLLKRVQVADGRSRAFVNDQPVSVGMMRSIGQTLVELHGQHDERALLDSSVHRSLLDAFGTLQPAVADVQARWREWRGVRREHAQLEKRVAEAAREADYLRDSVAELEQLSPEPGEETKLAERRQRMMKAETIATDLNDAISTIGGDHSPIPHVTALAKQLARKSPEVPGMLDTAVQHLDTAIDSLHLAQQELEIALREAEFDPSELERTEERLFALRAVSRKYSVAVENLPELAAQLADQLDALNSGEEKLAALKAEVERLETQYRESAETLSARRREAADRLMAGVMAELPSLKLENSEFIVEISSGDERAGEYGIDAVEFWVRTNPGARAGPIVKVASGGELSRFLLALKVALADKGSAPTLVFDEIDTGVGGAVADAIGKRLARLAQRVQVLAVTHAPQIAARASNHFVIAKQASGEAQERRMATLVEPIAGDERREEIARMLAGASITEEARAAAEQLINQTAA